MTYTMALSLCHIGRIIVLLTSQNPSPMINKKIHPFILVFALGCLLAALSFAHKYYVSTTQMQLNTYSNSFEIAMKIFTDDLERCLQDQNAPLKLGEKGERKDAEALLKSYLLEHFKVKINNAEAFIHFIGYESESHQIFCYLEIRNLPQMQTLEISNTILMEKIEGQSNIIDVRTPGWNKKIVLTYDTPSELLLPQ